MDNLLDRIKALEEIVLDLSKKQGGGGSGGGVSAIVGETPGGAVNGSNTTFTTASAFATGSLEVFLNGIRLTKTEDFTEGSSGFTMSVAPTTGDILRVCYFGSSTITITGGNNLVFNETLTGTADGSNKDFYTANVFVAGSVMLFRDGQAMKLTDDYTETTASKKISFVTAPEVGSVITATYLQSVGAPSANADTLDSLHANRIYNGFALPRCFVRLAVDQTLTTATTTPINWDTDVSDALGWHDTSTNKSRITVTESGLYLVDAVLSFNANTTGNRFIAIQVNGGAIPGRGSVSTNTVSNTASCNLSQIIELVAGDYIEITGYQNSGGDLTIRSGTDNVSCSCRVIKLSA